MRNLSRLLPAVFLFFLSPVICEASPKLVYEVPLQWILAESSSDSEIYETSLDRRERLVVSVRSVDTYGHSAETWVMNEADRMRTEGGRRLGQPTEERFGEVGWVYLDWQDPAADERGRKYYLEGEDRTLAEVSISARAEVFLRADAAQFDGFLSSFRFEEES